MKKNAGQLSREFSAIVRNRKVLIPVIAVITIPLLYSFMFLWAFWDPYAKMDQLPVAVVNMDKGAEFEGKSYSVGSDFVQKLKESGDFKWDFVSKTKAEDGLSHRKYYIAIEIPEDFSEKATQVLGDHPTPATFTFIPNESSNFLTSQIGKTAVERMKSELSAQLTKTYAETIFENITALAGGLTQAADGAHQLSDGSVSVTQGISAIDENLNKLAQGTKPIQGGLGQLTTGAAKLAEGLSRLQGGTGQLEMGINQLHDGGLKLEQGSKQAEQGTLQLKAGLSRTVPALDQLQMGSAGVAAGLEQFAAANPQLVQNPNFVKLLEASKQVAGGMKTASAAQKQLLNGAEKVAEGQQSLNDGLVLMNSKLAEAYAGSGRVSEAANQLAPGSQDLKNGLARLSGGVNLLAESTQKLDDGAKKLASGAEKVAAGTSELSGRLQDASEKTSGIKGSDKLYQAIAQPVAFQEEKVAAVPNYGTGFAPYFLSLGLFVGALLLTIVFPVKEPVLSPKSALSWFWGKTAVMLLVGLLQAAVMDAVMIWGLKIETQSGWLFFLVTVAASWTFMALIQLLVTVLGDPGRFVAIVLLIFQLTTSAGTFPVELIPNPLQKMNAWLPMTYSVQGFKAAISSGDFSYMWHNAGILLIYMAAAGIFTLGYFAVQFRRKFVSVPEDAVLQA